MSKDDNIWLGKPPKGVKNKYAQPKPELSLSEILEKTLLLPKVVNRKVPIIVTYEMLDEALHSLQVKLKQERIAELETIIKLMPTAGDYKTADQAIYKATVARIKQLEQEI